jgi:hypothetical protein
MKTPVQPKAARPVIRFTHDIAFHRFPARAENAPRGQLDKVSVILSTFKYPLSNQLHVCDIGADPWIEGLKILIPKII